MLKRLVCFGDSITARIEGHQEPMLTSKLSLKLNDFTVINSGVSGDNTSDALNRVESDVLNHNPDLVTVLFGANDAAFHKMIDITTFKENLLRITNKIGSRKIILITPAPVDENVQFARTNETLYEYAKMVKEVSYDSGSHLIDLFSKMIIRNDYRQLLRGKKNDGLHIGESGYEFLSQLIVDKIDELTLNNILKV
ncbi:esterase [Agaribacter marinus]|uniref:Esterase n=1 Tax=Virgibacillus salarius TaxID=447199 RepID=A0A941IAH9_9BACI|nr:MULTISPECIES: GDSL-type esterase/lipase family protein [Bacillaceae]MBR7795376.1 esterase [Virgibacillus salarius]NAZ08089.1 esterase [Agaribacter marinus]